MQTYSRRVLSLGLVLFLTACATAGRGDSNRTSRDLITTEQLDRFTNAYQAIEALHPTWLRPRGRNSITNPSQVRVYRDGMSIGGVDVLRSMPTVDIGGIRFYDAASATQRWGTGHAAGVIAITTGSG